MAVFHLYEIVSVRHRYPRPHWKGAVVTMSICAAYMIWIFYVHHVGQFGPLEDEMCAFTLDGLPDGSSPDRLDALVWAVTSLMPSHHASPRATQL